MPLITYSLLKGYKYRSFIERFHGYFFIAMMVYRGGFLTVKILHSSSNLVLFSTTLYFLSCDCSFEKLKEKP